MLIYNKYGNGQSGCIPGAWLLTTVIAELGCMLLAEAADFIAGELYQLLIEQVVE